MCIFSLTINSILIINKILKYILILNNQESYFYKIMENKIIHTIVETPTPIPIIESSDICDICCEPHNDETITLKCNHRFHYLCILESFVTITKRECPYCRTESDLLEYNKKYKKGPVHNIHKFCYEMMNENRCFGIITSGSRKGLQCMNYPCMYNNEKIGYCKRHYSENDLNRFKV